MFKSPWFYFGSIFVALVFLGVAYVSHTVWLFFDTQRLIEEAGLEVQAVLAEQQEREAEWSEGLPHNEILLERCGAPFYTLRYDEEGEGYACLRRVTSDLMLEKARTLKSQIDALDKGDCAAFFDLAGTTESQLAEEQPLIFAYLQDKGACVEGGKAAALKSLDENLVGHHYSYARLSAAYWSGDGVEKDLEASEAYALYAGVSAYLDDTTAYDGSEVYIWKHASDVDPAQEIWGMSYKELRLNFSWLLEGPWELPPPLLEMKERLRPVFFDETGDEAWKYAHWLKEAGYHTGAEAVLHKAANEANRGDFFYQTYLWRQDPEGRADWDIAFQEDKLPDDFWFILGPTCAALWDLSFAADLGHKPALEELVRFLLEFERPQNLFLWKIERILGRLTYDEERGLVELPMELKSMAKTYAEKDGLFPEDFADESYEYFRELYCGWEEE